jgi:hypothetical protein
MFEGHGAGSRRGQHGRMDGATARYRDGERLLVPCEGGPCTSRLVRYPPPLEFEEGHLGVYVLDERGPADDPEYVYVYVPERL